MTKEKFLEYCKEQGYNLTDDQFSGKERIDCTLYLDSLTSIPENWNPNGVRRSIYINDEVYDIKPIIKFINFQI